LSTWGGGRPSPSTAPRRWSLCRELGRNGCPLSLNNFMHFLGIVCDGIWLLPSEKELLVIVKREGLNFSFMAAQDGSRVRSPFHQLMYNCFMNASVSQCTRSPLKDVLLRLTLRPRFVGFPVNGVLFPHNAKSRHLIAARYSVETMIPSRKF